MGCQNFVHTLDDAHLQTEPRFWYPTGNFSHYEVIDTGIYELGEFVCASVERRLDELQQVLSA